MNTTPTADVALLPPLTGSRSWDALSEEAKEVVMGMLHYCLDGGIGMGMDEGWHEISGRCGDPIRTRKRSFRTEVEDFCAYEVATGKCDCGGEPHGKHCASGLGENS